MKILIDMNLSSAWVSVLEEAGHTASHWSTIGSMNAPDREILSWAKDEIGYVLFTHLTSILGQSSLPLKPKDQALSKLGSEDISPDHAKSLLLNILNKFGKNSY